MNTNPLVYVHPANFYVSLPNWIVSFTIPAFLCRFILRYSLIGWMNAWRVLTLRLGSRRLCELAEVDNILWIFYFSELGFNICSLTMDEYNDKSSSSFEVRNFRDRANEKKKKMVSLGFNTILFLYKRLNFQRCQASRNLFHHFSLLFFPSFVSSRFLRVEKPGRLHYTQLRKIARISRSRDFSLSMRLLLL